MSFFNTWAKTIQDKVLVWLHGRRLGIYGDGQNTTSGQPINNASLVLDGVTIGSTRTGATPFRVSAAGLNGAGAITAVGALVGDNVSFVTGPTNADSGSLFESTISVTGQVQQTSTTNLSGNQYIFDINPQAAV